MGRSSFAQAQIPTSQSDIPYPTHRQVASMLGHGCDMFVGEIVGAGGVGGVLEGIPFEPAIVDIYEPTGPTAQRHLPPDVEINLITGAASSELMVIAQEDDGTWSITLPTALAPNGDTTSLVVMGFPDQGGSL